MSPADPVGEERGAAAFRERAEVRDVLAWMRLLADPHDAAAVVRALARPPIELRQVDLARVIQVARRRKLDMVSALTAATESPQVPPDARERIQKLLVTGDNRLKQGVSHEKVRQSYEEALEVAREAGLEESIRPLVEVRLADLEQLGGESSPPVSPAA